MKHVLGSQQFGERLVGDDAELIDLPHTGVAPERQAQAAAHGLLGQHFRGHRPQRHDNGDILDVSAFLELVDAHHRQHG